MSQQQIESDSLSCEICLTRYNEKNQIPHIIPSCGHTICSSCLKVFLISNPKTFECPFDSTQVSLTQGGLSNFPKNFTLLKIIMEQTPKPKDKTARRKSLIISEDMTFPQTYSMPNIEQAVPASEELKLVIANKLSNLEKVLANIAKVEQKIYDKTEEAVNIKERHMLQLLDQKFAEFTSLLNQKKDEISEKVTTHFANVRDRVRQKQNPHESQYEAKTRVIEWKNIVKKKIDLWNAESTTETANNIIEEDETAMLPEINVWTTRIESVLALGNMDVLVDKSFLVFSEELAKTVSSLCELKVVNEDNLTKDKLFGSEEKRKISKDDNDSDTSPQDLMDGRKDIEKLFKAYRLKVDSLLSGVDRFKLKPDNQILLSAASDKKKKKFTAEKFAGVQQLEIHCEDFKDKNLLNLSEAIQYFTALKDLRIVFINCDKINDSSLDLLGAAISKLTSLQNLSLHYLSSSPKTSEKGPVKFFKNITGNLESQKSGSSSDKSVTEAGFSAFWKHLSAMPNLIQLKVVAPTNLKLEDEDLSEISANLKQMTQLQEFDFTMNGNDKFTNKGFSQLSDALSKLINLTTLSINLVEQSGNINDKGFSNFVQALTKLGLLKTLALELPRCFISNEKFIEFSQALSRLSFLKELSLNFSWSLLSDESFVELSKALSCLFSLTAFHVNFTACSISNKGFKELVNALSGLFNLHSLILDFSWCKDISNESVDCLGEMVTKLNNLSALEISFKEVKKITEMSAVKLCGMIPKFNNIEHFELNLVNCGRDFTENSKNKLEEAMLTGRRFINKKILVNP